MDNVIYRTEPLKARKGILELSNEEIARRANLHRHTIRQVLSGNPRVAVEKIAAVAKVLGVAMDELFRKEAA